MILLISMLLWCFTALVLVRLLRIGHTAPDLRPGSRRFLLMLAVVAAPLLGRPHELLQSGQDPGVYLNSAGAFARHQSLCFNDPLLAQVPLADRIYFLFGHVGYGLTKDSCLEIKNWPMARVGPRFPPAFPILISPLIHPAHPTLALYVTPLFAFFTAIVLCVLARHLTGRTRAGWLAAIFYLATPLVIWHARAPRPEVVAGFFALAGFVLALHAWQARAWERWPDLCLSAVCMALAPFFHVTAWFYTLGAAAVMLLWSASGRADALIYPVVAAVGLIGYTAQTWFVADQYSLKRFIQPCLERPLLAGTALLLMICLPALVCAVARWLQSRPAPQGAVAPSSSRAGWVRLAVAALLLATCAWMYGRTLPVAQRHFSAYDYHYIYPTDLRLISVYLSGPIAALALAGLLMLILSSRPGTPARLGFFVWTLPAALLVGNMQDFFMTRYLLPGVCPLVALGLATLVSRVSASSTRVVRPGLVAAVLVVLVLLHQHRRPMVTTTEFPGLAKLLAAVAAPVREADGILLAEYARLATPLEHIYGVPLLSLDNETRDDYTPALAAWESIMARHPSQPAFFLTPFPPPRHDTLTFTPVRSFRLQTVRLVADHYRLPRGAASGNLELFLYRVEHRPPPAPPLPWLMTPNAGNMGLVQFEQGRETQAQLAGLPLAAGVTTRVPLDCEPALNAGEHLFVFAHAAPGADCSLGVSRQARADGIAARTHALQNGWELLDLTVPGVAPFRAMSLVAARDTTVSDVWRIGTGGVARVALADSRPVQRLTSRTRAALVDARALLPIPAAGPAYAIMLVAATGATPADGAFELQQGTTALGRRKTAGNAWSWQVWPLAPGQNPSAWGWLVFRPPPEVIGTLSTSNTTALVRIAGMGVVSLTNAPGAHVGLPGHTE